MTTLSIVVLILAMMLRQGQGQTTQGMFTVVLTAITNLLIV